MKAPPVSELTIRSATKSDLDGICEIIRAYSIDMFGVDNDAKRNVELAWGQPNFRLNTDTRVLSTSDGRIVGYGEVEDTRKPHVQVGSWLRVHPDSRGIGLEAKLLDWIEQRARKAVDLAPEGTRVTVSQGVPDGDVRAQELFKTRGYSVVRHFSRLTIELDHEISEPAWAEGVSVRTFVLDEDLEELVRAFRDSFQDHWGHVEKSFVEDLKEWDYWIRNDKEFDPSLTFLAMADGEIAGFALCELTFSEDPAMGYIDVLAVRRAWRRRGIALALLQQAFRELQRRGQKRACLGVDATSLTGAHKLYEVAGMKPTRQISVFEKELRPGVELRLQSLETGEDSS